MTDIVSTFALPGADELSGRIACLREAMCRENIECYVCISVDNVYYLTHFANMAHERPFILAIGQDGPLRFLVPRLEVSHVEIRSIGDLELVTYPEFPAPAGHGWNDRLKAMLPARGRIGIESTCPMFLARELGDRGFVADLIDDQRMVKSPFELARIQWSSDVATQLHSRFLAEGARPGLALARANAEMSASAMSLLLAAEPALNFFATRISFGFQPPSVSWDPHNFTDISMALEHGGPNVSLFNGVMNGYATEVERTFFLGQVPEAAKRPFETMMEARRAVLDAARPGEPMSEADRRANEIFRKAGHEAHMLHRAGHGIGITGHEAPFFAEGCDRIIEPGMVFTIEPGIYVPGLGGFRHSDTLRIDENGPVLMTGGPVELAELILPV